jgi:hypothetical protein
METAKEIDVKSPEELVDYVGGLKEELKAADNMLREVAEIPEGEKSVEIVGLEYRAVITDRHEKKFSTPAIEEVFGILGPGAAKLLFNKVVKTTYGKNAEAIDRLFTQRQDDEKMQEAKRLLKKDMKETTTRSVKMEKLKD